MSIILHFLIFRTDIFFPYISNLLHIMFNSLLINFKSLVKIHLSNPYIFRLKMHSPIKMIRLRHIKRNLIILIIIQLPGKANKFFQHNNSQFLLRTDPIVLILAIKQRKNVHNEQIQLLFELFPMQIVQKFIFKLILILFNLFFNVIFPQFLNKKREKLRPPPFRSSFAKHYSRRIRVLKIRIIRFRMIRVFYNIRNQIFMLLFYIFIA